MSTIPSHFQRVPVQSNGSRTNLAVTVPIEVRLQQALDKITDLEQRLAALESVISVSSGNVRLRCERLEVDSRSAIRMRSDESLILAAGWTSGVRFTFNDFEIKTPGKLTLESNSQQMTAGNLRIDAGTVEVSNRIKADSVEANNIIGRAYTPGAGNVW